MKTIQTSQGRMKLRPNVAKLVQAFDTKERTRLTIDQIPYTAHITVVEVQPNTGEMVSLSLRNLERVTIPSKPRVRKKTRGKPSSNRITTIR